MAGKSWAAKQEQRGYVWLAGELRASIAAGTIAAGESLPPTRQLGAEHGVSPETARWAIKELVDEGLVVSEPRKGYRVQARANNPDRGLPIAFVVSKPAAPGRWDDFHHMLFSALQNATAERGWSLLAVGLARRSAQDISAQLRDCRACGMIVDTVNQELVDAVAQLGMPTVMMDDWDPAMKVSAVVQDGFQGGLIAARYLAGRGHQRIGWLGPIAESTQSHERFGGAVAGLTVAGIRVGSDCLPDTPRAQAAEAARRMLSMPNRPTGVLALWHECAQAAVQAVRELGLELGRDVEVVGWTPEEQYDTAYRALFDGGPVPPTVVWSVARLARAAVARLTDLRNDRALPPLLIRLPTRLRLREEN